MASRDLNDLHPQIMEKEALMRQKAKEQGLEYIITCIARDIKEQTAIFAQGRELLINTNKLRTLANLPHITEAENKKIVTWTLVSDHIIDLNDGDSFNDKARAFDVVLLKDKKAHYDIKVSVNKNQMADYEELGLIGESVGLKWGGRFKNKKGLPQPDMPHFYDKIA